MASERSFGSFSESAGTSSTPYRDSFDDGEDYITQRSRSTFIGRTLHNLGFRRRSPHNRDDDFILNLHKDDLPAGLLKSDLSPQRQRLRSKGIITLRRSALALPIAVLTLFGLFKLLHIVLGQSGVWENFTGDRDFLSDWIRQGHEGASIAGYPTDATRDVKPIQCHSHNDYWRSVPLFEALHWGCTSVEADLWMFDEELYVGHNIAALTKQRTFRKLYVDPLRELLDSMNPHTELANTTDHGVFDEDPEQTLVLLVDFKTAGRELFPHVQKQLQPLREKNYLSYWDGETFQSRAVTVVGTGNAPFDMIIANTTYRDIFFDAPLAKLWEPPVRTIDTDTRTSNPTRHGPGIFARTLYNLPIVSLQGQSGIEAATSLDDFNPGTSYYASVSFASTVGFVWRSHLTPQQMDTIQGQIRGAQRRGLKVRYWDTPSWPISVRNFVWHVLVKEGVDMLNVDDLKGAATENWERETSKLW